MRITVLMSVESPWSRMIVGELAAAGHDLFIAYPSTERAATALEQGALDGIASGTLPLGASPPERFWQARRLGRWCRANGSEHLLTLYGGWYSVIAWMSGFKPFSVYIVGSDILLAKGLKRAFLGEVLRHARWVFANGIALGKATASASGRRDIVALYHGIRTGEPPSDNSGAEAVEIICSRWFEPIYNNEMILRALQLLPDDLPAFRMTFLAGGSGLEQARALADEILPPARRAMLSFLGGVSHSELLSRYRQAHIYASVSNSDGTSTSLLEAFATGLFPVVTDIPANTEWIKPELHNGSIVPCGDAASLSLALAHAIRDEAMRKKAARYNRLMVVEQADLKRNMTRMVEMLKS